MVLVDIVKGLTMFESNKFVCVFYLLEARRWPF